MLMNGRAVGPEYSKMHVMLEASAQENMEPLTSPRLLNTHLPYERSDTGKCIEPNIGYVYTIKHFVDVFLNIYILGYPGVIALATSTPGTIS